MLPMYADPAAFKYTETMEYEFAAGLIADPAGIKI